ncbi:hypothetical protein [Bremerella cremea]|uniref:hypothetical protein n=1 Tax=Bremerella cremea TaxID=1031537 RepID=UPI0011C03CA2|nr:hypothetical protein [Bremerella cremea]
MERCADHGLKGSALALQPDGFNARYRRRMQLRFDADTYRKRSEVETAMSMIKRRQGNVFRGKTDPSRHKESHLMLLTHNVMILW